MQKKWSEQGPNQTAYELLGHLKAGEKVAITTRFNSPEVHEYVQAMEGRGLIVRVITGLSDVEDFCFLSKAKRGLAGSYKSSFFKWAAFLGQAERVQLCREGWKGAVQHGRKGWSFFSYN